MFVFVSFVPAPPITLNQLIYFCIYLSLYFVFCMCVFVCICLLVCTCCFFPPRQLDNWSPSHLKSVLPASSSIPWHALLFSQKCFVFVLFLFFSQKCSPSFLFLRPVFLLGMLCFFLSLQVGSKVSDFINYSSITLLSFYFFYHYTRSLVFGPAFALRTS